MREDVGLYVGGSVGRRDVGPARRVAVPPREEATELASAHRGGVGDKPGPGTGVAEEHVINVAEGAGRRVKRRALDLCMVIVYRTAGVRAI